MQLVQMFVCDVVSKHEIKEDTDKIKGDKMKYIEAFTAHAVTFFARQNMKQKICSSYILQV